LAKGMDIFGLPSDGGKEIATPVTKNITAPSPDGERQDKRHPQPQVKSAPLPASPNEDMKPVSTSEQTITPNPTIDSGVAVDLQKEIEKELQD